jgi:hypothetical protein
LLLKYLDKLVAVELRVELITRSPEARTLSVFGDASDAFCSLLALNEVFRVRIPDFSTKNPTNSAPKMTLISDVAKIGKSSRGRVNPWARRGASNTAQIYSTIDLMWLKGLIKLVVQA